MYSAQKVWKQYLISKFKIIKINSIYSNLFDKHIN